MRHPLLAPGAESWPPELRRFLGVQWSLRWHAEELRKQARHGPAAATWPARWVAMAEALEALARGEDGPPGPIGDHARFVLACLLLGDDGPEFRRQPPPPSE